MTRSIQPPRWRLYALFLLAITVLLAGFAVALTAYSHFPLSLAAFGEWWQGGESLSTPTRLVIDIRLPRVLVAVCVGANLAIAGLLMQAITRNPLASPTILGINSGAACLVALASVTALGDLLPTTLLQALIGAMIAATLVMVLAGYTSDRLIHPLRLILSGVAINALLLGATRAALIVADESSFGVLYWLAGSIANSRWENIPWLLPLSLFGFTWAWWLSPRLNILALGDDVASSLGTNVISLQRQCASIILLLTAASVAVSGPIAFVGLIIPHAAKKLLLACRAHSYQLLIPLVAILGAALMAWSDVLSRAVAFPAETPVGLLTALIGAPFFILLACKRRT
ncbi:iron chelate uptake ABC transporter family permease subunit [Cardiobacteriaceae bacterium TAE3-ERU3]|nr:iron chelate uptake ABC transporter family permease subunit [Cardiobacteriaceae bacterium TAE3-ERU3]